MSQSDRAIKKFATQLARLDREVKSWRGAQADFTSIENGGNFTFKDSDGNVTAIMGGQDDGSNTIRHVDGPTPPIPSGLSAHVDGPIIQVSWDGTFEDADNATYDWSHLEVIAVGPSNEQLTATINDITGASTNLAATASGEWVVVARSVSRAEKRSLDGDAGTVEVKLVDIDGAIEAVQDSANGKNKVTYSSHAPTEDDPGIFDDTWFVGQVGRPNDIIEGKNRVRNPSAVPSGTAWTTRTGSGTAAAMSATTRGGMSCFRATTTAGSSYVYLVAANDEYNPASLGDVVPGEVISAGMLVACSGSRSLSLRMGFRDSAGTFIAWSAIGPAVTVPANGPLTQLKLENQIVPAGATQVYVHVTNSTASGAGDWVEGTRAFITQGETLPEFFDGDTTDGATDNESHYRWAGEPHASTSEKYLPALNIGESDNWNVIEQYRHDGTGWVKVELSHYVFSTVDLGKATVGELDGIRIMGQTISGEQLSADAIDGKVITGGTYRTSGGNGSWSDAGLFISQPDGTSMVRFPTDGSPLSLTASDTQIDRASIGELDLSYGAVRSGGEFTLASGVTAPALPPEITTTWDKLCTLPKPPERSDYANFAYWSNGNQWVRAINVLGTGEGDRIEIYDYDTGELDGSFPIEIDARHGVTVAGDIVYIMGKDHNVADPRVFIFGYNLTTGARTSRHEYTRNIQAKNALGNDGTNLIVASVYNLELWVHKRNPTSGVQVGSDMRSGSNSWPESGGRDLFGVRISGNDVEVVTAWGGRVYFNSNNALVRKTDTANASGYAGWVLPAHDISGCDWINGAPYPMDSSGVVLEGTTQASDYTAEVCYTWYDGTFETTPSPAATINVAARETVTISLPYRAGLQKRVYTREGARWRRNTLAPETTVADIYTGVLVFGLPTTNSFPNAAPAVLKSTNGNVVVRGDGSGKWGPLTFNADGTMTSTQIPAWVPVTTFKTGFGPQTWGYAPAYRIWPDGKVEWRGIVAGTIGAGQTPLFTIPTAAVPAQSVQVAAATSYSSNSNGSTARVEFGKVGELNLASAYEGSESRSWVSLDGLDYYLT